MKAEAYNLSVVFGSDRQLSAPLYQRPYVWEKEKQWKPLWEDIKLIAEHLLHDANSLKPHFLGAIVLEQLKVPIGKPDSRSIIDGQQRLASIQILMAALRDICITEERLIKMGRSIERLIFNDESMVNEEDDRYKVWPTNIDHAAYRIIMSTRSPEEAISELKKNDGADKSNIADAYFYFHNAIKEWAIESGELSEDRLQALVNTIRQGLLLVVVDMGTEDNAQLIFETLNARGTPLLPSDLVKNFLFHKAKERKLDVEALYESYWFPFDYNHAFWREAITQGRLKRPRIDLLLQHYLTLQKKDEVSARSLFQEFQHVSEDNTDKDPEWFLKSLRQHGEFFKHFLTITRDSREGAFFQRLRTMDTTTVFPFLLGLYENFNNTEADDEEMVAILIALESFLVRRMVCRMTTKNYNRLFLDLLLEMMSKERFSYDGVRVFLSEQTSDANKWPSDAEFKWAWSNEPIYRAITRPRLRMILLALDEGLHDPKTEPYKLVGDNLTVEHLMPQLWKDHWPLPEITDETYEEKIDRQGIRERLIQTIGNLFYLTVSLNPYVSNGPFEKKKEKILDHSAINLNRPFLRSAQQWDESSIQKRGEDLFEIALRIWPGPDEKVQEKSWVAFVPQVEEQEEGKTKAEAQIDEEWGETDFFKEALQNLGEIDASALRTFYIMANSSPYEIHWRGGEDKGCFEMEFPQLCSGSVLTVHSNGYMDINFGNIRGSENADLFREVLRDELRSKMEFEVPDEAEDGTSRHSAASWINRSDTLMDILDDLLEEYIEVESS